MIEHEGKKYARVSDILRPFADYSHIDPFVLANKARIGTSVHEAIEDDVKGGFPCPDADGMGYFNSYLAWKHHMGPIFLKSEQRYFDEEKMITGQVDAVVAFGRSEKLPMLVDFKTSVTEAREVWPMQAHFYAYLLARSGIIVAPKMLFIKLHPNGTVPKVYPYVWDANTWAKCSNAVDDFWSKIAK
jgi:hypothetical protein